MDIDQLRRRLLDSGIAREADLLGCTPDEIAALDQRYGPLPESYRAIMGLIGHRAGRLVDQHEFWIYCDQIDRTNAMQREYLEIAAEDGETVASLVPPNAFFISCRYGEYPCYLIPEGGDDAAVWFLNSDRGTVALGHPSVWGWIMDFVKDAEHFIGLGAAEQGARRA